MNVEMEPGMEHKRGQRIGRAWTVMLLLSVMSWAVGQDAMYGSWSVVWRVDPISDENSSYIGVFASEHPTLADRSMLAVRCTVGLPHSVEIFVAADSYLTNADTVRVDYRFDDREAHVGARWSTSVAGTGAFLFPGQVAAFVQEALASNELVWRVYDYRDSPFLYRFSLDGFNDALAALGCYEP